MRWSQSDLDEFRARSTPGPQGGETPDAGPEAKLQSKCLKYCKERGFPTFHDWSWGRNAAGWPDLFVFAKDRVVLVELKTARGKLRKEQAALKQTLEWLGHAVHVCKSYAGFIRIMEAEK